MNRDLVQTPGQSAPELLFQSIDFSGRQLEACLIHLLHLCTHTPQIDGWGLVVMSIPTSVFQKNLEFQLWRI